MNSIPDRAVMCEVLKEEAARDRNIVVLCSDSRGSGSMTSFAQDFPDQFVEVGIAEQNLVGIAAGLAACGKKAFAVSPASFLTARSYEQCKVDCAYSGTNVKLVGISGGISYGALGMTHHSAQDIAAMSAIPGMRVYLPSDRHQTRRLFQELLKDTQTAYIRLGRNPGEDVSREGDMPFEMDKATVLCEGKEVLLVSCGEMVKPALDAAHLLNGAGISTGALDMYCVKPLDKQGLLKAARGKKLVVTVEEHSPFGGLGAATAQVLSANDPKRVICLSLPDEPVITGTSLEVFAYYGLDAQGIVSTVRNALGK
ncbi:MAG: transketolase family protein [Clostridia bacterium]|nr:transketolase family protein [Clostridia bacterium]